MPMHQFLKTPGGGGYAAQALQQIQAHPLMRQQIAARSFNLENYISRVNVLAIVFANSHLEILAHQQPAKFREAGNYAGFFSEDLRARMLIG
jgi:hypothetical protein